MQDTSPGRCDVLIFASRDFFAAPCFWMPCAFLRLGPNRNIFHWRLRRPAVHWNHKGQPGLSRLHSRGGDPSDSDELVVGASAASVNEWVTPAWQNTAQEVCYICGPQILV